MKTITAFLCLTGIALLSAPMLGQSGHSGNPDITYDVQKEYDEDGNLIYYDSTAVYSWHSFAGDSTQGSNNQMHDPNSFQYSFQIPGDIFHFTPDFNFSMDFPEIDELMRAFGYDFRVSPSDSADSKCTPDTYNFDFHGTLPGFHPQFELRMQDMREHMMEMHRRIREEMEEWYDDLPSEEKYPQDKEEDSTPKQQSYPGNIFNI